MGTIVYFEKDVEDAAKEETISLVAGTSGFAGNGPQMYINLGGESVLLSHDDAKQFCEEVDRIAGYFGYWKK